MDSINVYNQIKYQNFISALKMIYTMQKPLLSLCFLLFATIGNINAQQITLDQCNEMATQNYPLIKQYSLIEKSKEYTISNANKAYLPQVSITAIEGYVFGDFPSMGTGDDSKFKFIGLGQINQTIWDGGATKTQKNIIKTSSDADKASIDVSMYELRSRVNQLYFGILLIDEQIKQLDIQNKILGNTLDKVNKMFDNGLAYKTDVDEIKVERLNIEKQKKDFTYTRQGYQTVLSYLTGISLNESTHFEIPLSKLTTEQSINRPELTLYNKQRELIQAQSEMQKVGLMPKLGLLGTGVVFAPGINLGATKMSSVGVLGVSASWDTQFLYKNANEKKLTQQKLDQINVQEETFLFNTNFQMKQKNADIERKEAILKDDQEIVKLRQNIREGYQLKYDTGAGPLTDLLNATEKEGAARAEKALHEIQLLISKYEYQTISGN